MAKYKEIKGVTVQTRSEDPTVNAGTWATGGSLNTGRESVASSGILTSGQAAAGYASTGVTNVTENYDGTSWTEIAEVNTGRRQAKAAGTANTASIVFGGDTSGNATGLQAVTETWNGSSWTEVADLNTARSRMTSSQYGSVTAAIAAAGSPPSPAFAAITEQWDGSSWTEVADLNTARRLGFGSGVSTSMIVASGLGPGPARIGNVETWDGSSWTEVAEVNTNRNSGGSSGVSNTSSLIFGGDTPPGTAKTEDWNGSAWTEVADLGTAERDNDGAGTAADAFSVGGNGYESRTEEWSFPSGPHLNEGDLFLSGGQTLKGFGKAAGIATATWASQTAFNTARGDALYGFGTTSAAGIAGGAPPPPTSGSALTEIWNGSSWTESGDLNQARYFCIASGGPSTAAIGVAGTTTTPVANTELWNGSTWTETTDINTNRRGPNSNQPPASQTQILIYGGASPTIRAQTELWDGSTWTEQTDMNTTRYTGGGGGSGPGDAIAASGTVPPATANCEIWDGSSWTEVANVNTARVESGSSGATSTSALLFAASGGDDRTEFWNGSSWTEVGDLANGGQGPASHIGPGAVNTFKAGGQPPAGMTNTVEEFTADNALADITVS